MTFWIFCTFESTKLANQIMLLYHLYSNFYHQFRFRLSYKNTETTEPRKGLSTDRAGTLCPSRGLKKNLLQSTLNRYILFFYYFLFYSNTIRVKWNLVQKFILFTVWLSFISILNPNQVKGVGGQIEPCDAKRSCVLTIKTLLFDTALVMTNN